jgi:glycosyltransferase involved in cell wall biosynthesis
VDLSVVIPARNVAAVLPEQLDALLAQEWDGAWEVVVVDNRSTDDTARVVDEYARRDPRVRLVSALDRDGASYARNVALAATDSAAVAFCDADDIVGEHWVATMGGSLRGHRCVTGPLEVELLNPRWLAETRGIFPTDRCLTWFGLFPTASGGNLGLQRRVWERVGPFDETFPAGEDQEFSFRLYRAGVDVRFEPGALLHYRFREEPPALWRQGHAYGYSRPLLRKQVREHGLDPPSRVAGWRSWLWLVVNLHLVLTPQGRSRWLWVAGNRIGQLRGSLHEHSLFV